MSDPHCLVGIKETMLLGVETTDAEIETTNKTDGLIDDEDLLMVTPFERMCDGMADDKDVFMEGFEIFFDLSGTKKESKTSLIPEQDKDLDSIESLFEEEKVESTWKSRWTSKKDFWHHKPVRDQDLMLCSFNGIVHCRKSFLSIDKPSATTVSSDGSKGSISMLIEISDVCFDRLRPTQTIGHLGSDPKSSSILLVDHLQVKPIAFDLIECLLPKADQDIRNRFCFFEAL